jgi:hypothetical protein
VTSTRNSIGAPASTADRTTALTTHPIEHAISTCGGSCARTRTGRHAAAAVTCSKRAPSIDARQRRRTTPSAATQSRRFVSCVACSRQRGRPCLGVPAFSVAVVRCPRRDVPRLRNRAGFARVGARRGRSAKTDLLREVALLVRRAVAGFGAAEDAILQRGRTAIERRHQQRDHGPL